MSVLCSVNMDLVVAVEVDETASADKLYGVTTLLASCRGYFPGEQYLSSFLRLKYCL